MNRSRFLFFLASLALLVPIVSGTLAGAVSGEEEAGEDSLYRHLSVFSEILSLVRRTYVDETSLDQLFAGAMDGSTDALDPLATYIPAEHAGEFERVLRVGTSRCGLHLIRERGVAYVLSAIPGSPAEAAGLKTGDILSKLDDEGTRQMPLWRLMSRFAAAPGTKLSLEVLRRGQVHRVDLELADFAPPVPVLEVQDGVPVLRLRGVDAAAPPAVGGLLESVRDQGSRELIVDLRGVSQGDPGAAYALGDLFADGELGTLSSRGQVLSSFTGTPGLAFEGRLLVLTDRGTQGAGEILAAILVQGAGGELIGERTFGHAGRQSLVPLSTGAQVYLTDAFYSGPNGEPIASSLEPAVQVSQARAPGETSVADPILDRALDLLEREVEAGERDAA